MPQGWGGAGVGSHLCQGDLGRVTAPLWDPGSLLWFRAGEAGWEVLLGDRQGHQPGNPARHTCYHPSTLDLLR